VHAFIPIGIVHSTLQSLEQCPLQESEEAPEAWVEIFPEFIAACKEIHHGAHLILLTWLHQADRRVLVTHPRNDPTTPLTGVFMTRSPDRPNPIGIHIVTVLDIQNNRFLVSNLEVLNETPILDIKPVIHPLLNL
jgi:tRNA-Thr(GGU) m(6)t(6)A37 methyltransferase TsaA